jgi:hypothetical protein
MWGAACRLKKHQDQGQSLILLHLGDHDPSGKDMSRDILDRLESFELKNLRFKRLALNIDQIEQYNPPPNPTKLTDSRAKVYIDKFGYNCWELDALEPQVISDLIDNNVRKYRNAKQYNAVLKQERDEKSLLEELSENWPKVAENWEAIKNHYC